MEWFIVLCITISIILVLNLFVLRMRTKAITESDVHELINKHILNAPRQLGFEHSEAFDTLRKESADTKARLDYLLKYMNTDIVLVEKHYEARPHASKYQYDYTKPILPLFGGFGDEPLKERQKKE